MLIDATMEEWKVIEGYEMYEVSTHGRVRSYRNNKWGLRTEPKILKPSLTTTGYWFVVLYPKKQCVIHRLVANAFLPNPENKPEVDHIDRNPTNNMVSNLRWVTRSENQINTKDRPCKLNERNITMNHNNYMVQIQRNNKIAYRKTFKTLEEAIEARDAFLTDAGEF